MCKSYFFGVTFLITSQGGLKNTDVWDFFFPFSLRFGIWDQIWALNFTLQNEYSGIYINGTLGGLGVREESALYSYCLFWSSAFSWMAITSVEVILPFAHGRSVGAVVWSMLRSCLQISYCEPRTAHYSWPRPSNGSAAIYHSAEICSTG